MKLLRDMGYFGILCLMVLGVGGLIYHAVGKEGWIDRLLGGLFHHGIGTAVGLVIGTSAILWVGRRWMLATQSNQLFNDFLMYGMVALGLFFVGRYAMLGAF